MVDSWKIIPKRESVYSDLTLVVKRKKKPGYILKIPRRLREQSEYFRGAKLIYANLLEKGDLLMIQFVPREQVEEDTRIIHYSELHVSKDVIRYDMNGKKKEKIAYHLDKHNIIIDREPFKKLHK